MHLAVLVVSQRILLQTLLHHPVGYHNIVARLSPDDEVKDIQQLPSITPAITQDSPRLTQFDVPPLQFHILRHRSLQQLQQVILLQRFQHIELTA